MKRILLLLLLSCQIGMAQIVQRPNYEEIKNLMEKEGENNYQTLLKRLTNRDTTLSNDQYYVLYYGQANQKNYSPYTVKNRPLLELLKQDKLDEFVEGAKIHLKDSPFDLEILNYFSKITLFKKDSTNYKTYVHSLNGFISAILSSGRGKSTADAIHVMSVPDEYVILGILGFKIAGRKSQTPYDIFQLAENKYNVQEMYFDASIPFAMLSKILGTTSEQKKK